MERSEHLKICKRCTNRKFDMNKGIVCGLTNNIADFEINCNDYIPDPVAIKQEDASDLAAANTFEGRREQLKTAKAEFRAQTDSEKVVKSGANWFYWIAGLSLINSLTLLTESEFGFIVGLGITQLFDGALMEMFGGYSIWSLIPTILFSGLFVIFGYNANKFSKSAFIAGMIIYGLDSLIFLLVSDFLSIGFHIFALVMIYKGFSHLKDVKVQKSELPVDAN